MDIDTTVRTAIGGSIRGGRIPAIADVATSLGIDIAVVAASFDRLAQSHVFIPRRGSSEIYAYNPFCVGPTAFRVSAGGRDHWAICGWDALGIPAALGVPGEIDTRCPDCDEDVRVHVSSDGSASAESDVVFGVGVPAREFWSDIYHT